jgi:predicted ATPase
VESALARELAVLAVTDHNDVVGAPQVMEAAEGSGLLVLPGIEISTNEGHLLAIFAPEALPTLQAFAVPSHLGLKRIAHTNGLRTARSMVDLVEEIAAAGGLAIPAHVDSKDGIQEAMTPRALSDLLASPGLAALEFTNRESLTTWFSRDDPDSSRRAAWLGRLGSNPVADRGLARVMSSDAHSPDKVGGDRPSRTMTRLRLDEPTFESVRNALVSNPKARCKAEADLPQAYPRIVSSSFEGGFLDGVSVDFSPNLNTFIGGRGSGKSTALIAIRAALGANPTGDENPDERGRMPDKTTVLFVDRAGNHRTAVRERGGFAQDPQTGAPISLDLADMGQGATGKLARGYVDDPGGLREFLDAFVDLDGHRQRQGDLLGQLGDNATRITSNDRDPQEFEALTSQVKQLEDSVRIAQQGNLEELARYATQLTAETNLITELEALTAELTDAGMEPMSVDLIAMASTSGVDPQRQPIKEFLGSDEGIDNLLAGLARKRGDLRAQAERDLTTSATPLKLRVDEWKSRHAAYVTKMEARRAELDAQGLTIQAGEIMRVVGRLDQARKRLADLAARRTACSAAKRERVKLLNAFHEDRDAEHQRRKATLKAVVAAVNAQADEGSLRVHIAVEANADDQLWCRWLTTTFSFRQPRVGRVANEISPRAFSEALHQGRSALESLKIDGDSLSADQVEAILAKRSWSTIFELETMVRDDRIRLEVQEPEGPRPKPFDHLSAGQQRSVLLSMLLSADRDQPLIVDQPEDHLDASYIATSIVRQLETAKERRQVILATHSPNLTVLGDAELVIPMFASQGTSRPRDAGAVDRPDTRAHVCTLLEGGRDAYRRRGERYGFDVRPAVR